ncbi:hypothetical protein FHR81_001808 [Actinoalloteichus hoggarensis]|uniref:Uncharacterized protein n=1 Tax=Actinoalloteichus hoggarensis TaxID=1470176 RepID=A0A221W5G5_9PSEU|nr:hypothetical protein [Actinoalloteichus hoggarensis]ASO20839.1 hypothetical protein AHOG_16065 [Actinoalloteichus hoggarensis]MBB5920770.1 hypothetical protein [Actinoalloteichus hoggarensis]
MIRRVSVLALTIPLATSCAVAAPELASGVTEAPAQAWSAPPIDATFDYRIGGDYPLPDGDEVVSRGRYAGEAPAGVYGSCYVNAFETQSDDGGLHRPDARSRWPAHLVLSELGDDPDWAGST